MIGLSNDLNMFCSGTTTYNISDIQSFSQSVTGSIDIKYLALMYAMNSYGQSNPAPNMEPFPNTPYNPIPRYVPVG